MKRNLVARAGAFLIWIVPLLYLLITYHQLPDTMPLHFGIDGKPDRYGDRSEFVLAVLMLAIVAAVAFLLIHFLPRIDPKRKARYSQGTFSKVGFALLLFMSLMNVSIIYGALHQGFPMSKLIFVLIGFLLAYLGNAMHSIKPNYFVGIRTPWTLESEETWRKTHQLAAKIWLPGGILIALICLVLSPRMATIFFAAAVFIMAFIPIVYSYLYFKKHQTSTS